MKRWNRSSAFVYVYKSREWWKFSAQLGTIARTLYQVDALSSLLSSSLTHFASPPLPWLLVNSFNRRLFSQLCTWVSSLPLCVCVCAYSSQHFVSCAPVHHYCDKCVTLTCLPSFAIRVTHSRVCRVHCEQKPTRIIVASNRLSSYYFFIYKLLKLSKFKCLGNVLI